MPGQPHLVRFNTQEVIDYNANGRKRISLTRGSYYREIFLKLTATIEVEAGGTTTAPANIQPGDLWGVVKDINLIVNGNDSLRRISGEELLHMNRIFFGQAPKVPNLLGLAAENTRQVECTLILPIQLPLSFRPIETSLNSQILQSLSLEITWGDETDVGSGTGFVFNVDPQIEVFSLTSFLPPKSEGYRGPFHTLRLNTLKETGVGVNTRFKYNLNTGNIYRGFVICTKTTAGVDATDKISNIKVVSGTTVFYDMDLDVIRSLDDTLRRRRHVLESTAGVADNSGTPSPEFLSSGTKLDAWTFVDLVPSDRMTEAIDTLSFAEFSLIFDVTSAIDELRIIPIEILPVRN